MVQPVSQASRMPFEPMHGRPVPVAPGIVRVTCNNPSPFTFHGTNSYLIGTDTLAVIDPGPEDEAHLAALIEAIGGRKVSHVLVTHTHADHSPLARALSAATGAIIAGCGAHVAARPLHEGELNPLDAAADRLYRPDMELADGALLTGDGWTIEAVATPGHTANHLCLAVCGTGYLFSGDHVMAWSTSIVAPPDGSMADYMASLDRLMARPETTYLPGHGGPVSDAPAVVRAHRTHRRMRERAIVERLAAGDRFIPDMVREIYRDTDPRLHGAAALSVLAHLEDMVSRGLARCDGEPAIDRRFGPADGTS